MAEMQNEMRPPEEMQSLIEGWRPKYLLAVPAMDYRIDVSVMCSIMAVQALLGRQAMFHVLCGNSNIADARNKLAHYFMRHTPCEQMIWIDSDITFSVQDFKNLCEGEDEHQIVITPYARKVLGKQATEWGFGFVRTARSVFQNLADWVTEDGQDALPRYMSDGELAVHFFNTGAFTDMRWFGEDTGFWHWCQMREIPMRKELRNRVGHVGRFVYGYPDQTPGLIPIEAGAQ